MILVADSGSTKTDWIAGTTAANQRLFHTPGFNPFFHDYDFVTKSLNECEGLKTIRTEISAVYFFGSGCSSPERIEQIKKPIADFFQSAEVMVEHDMLGCALSVCEGLPGIACIIGTGSNTCLFDGKILAPVRHGLGYILGDEASGSYFGKKLLSGFIYKILPAELQEAFQKNYAITKEQALFHVYKQPAPNVYLASFAPFIMEHQHHPWITKLVNNALLEFFETNILSYSESKTLPVHFTGSVAYLLREPIRTTAKNFGIKTGNIIQKPVNGLADYFLNGGKIPGR